jgi:Zn-dependent protease with chaperone function/tetratricopeptide (TPR) repeat protein
LLRENSVNTIVVTKRERPIAAPVKAGLIFLLTLLTLLYFPLCLLALLFIGFMWIVDLFLMLIMLRFGAPEALVPPMRRLWRLARAIVSTVRSPREGAKYHIELTEAEAPHLFATVRDCARRIGSPEPDSIVLEMTCGAWVLLEGYRSGKGRSTLGLGFHLLAGLDQQEIEAIILHEMAHARLVQRGAKKISIQGVLRFIRLDQETRELIYREQPVQGESFGQFWTAGLLARLTALASSVGVRMYALYSRQDEFEADKSSASLCGGTTFAGALLKSSMLDAKAADITWHDCVMQSQREGSYTEWMRGKLRLQDEKELAKLRREAFDRDQRSQYSFHPTIEDRIAHVREEGSEDAATVVLASAPAVSWFQNSDATVDRLFSLIERALMDEERAESENLSRWERKRRFKRDPNALETLGIVLVMLGVIGLIVSLVAWSALAPSDLALAIVGSLAAAGIGVALYRLAAPPPPDMLPVPTFDLFEDSMERCWNVSGNYAPVPQTPFVAPGGPSASAGRSERLQYWTERGHRSLETCDYAATLTYGLEALKAVRTNLQGMLLAGVAYNCLRQEAEGDRLLGQVISVYPRNPAVRWAMAWACLATGNWAPAEAYMLGVVQTAPPQATLLAALALAQGQRGNLRQAIENMQRAVALDPTSMRLRLRLVQYMLMAGRARAAVPEIEAIEKFPNAGTDRDVQLSLVRLHLMLNHKEAADAQARITSMQHPEAQTFFRLGASYAMTDHFDDATAYFHHATANALYPMAWIQLGFLHEKAERKAEARVCFLGAVNLLHRIADKAEDPFDVLDAALAGLRGLRPPSPTLFLWEVVLDVRELPAFKMLEFMLLVLAPNQAGAVGYARELYEAMHPGGPPMERILRRSEKANLEPPDSATEPGIVDWRGRR